MSSRSKARRFDRMGYFCKECGGEHGKWFGRCPNCGAWNTLVEAPDSPRRAAGQSMAAPTDSPRRLRGETASPIARLLTGITEFDRTLGGGLVPGAVILLGGDPGVGKSTLAMQAAGAIAASGEVCLYMSGEESREQVALRATRIGSGFEDVLLGSGTRISDIEQWARDLRPRLLIVDSIQTAHTPDADGAPGSISQVRECAFRLHSLAKSHGIATILIGHVTKEGSVAGPRLLEHMVDAVLYLEGERVLSYRVLRAVKNRFGSTDEIGIFEMREAGLVGVPDPSRSLGGAGARRPPGSVVVPTLEGTRPILLEVQALVTPTAYGTPQRVTSGIDPKRLAVLLAVLRRHAGVDATGHDVFVNVVAGIRVREPAVDLGILAAISSSLADVPLAEGVALIGEVGLAGEVRSVTQSDRRVAEAIRVGYDKLIIPSANTRDLSEKRQTAAHPVTIIADALEALEILTAAAGVHARARRTEAHGRGGHVERQHEGWT